MTSSALIERQLEVSLAGYEIATLRLSGSGEDIFRNFVTTVAATVPAWRGLTWHGTRRATIQSLPLLRREEVAADPARFIASTTDLYLETKTTSGFTGMPLSITYDVCAQYVLNHSLYAFVFSVFPEIPRRLRPGDISVGLVTNKPGRTAQTVLLPSLGATLWQRYPLDDDHAVQAICEDNPPVVYGKPMYIRELVDLLRRKNASLRPDCVLTSGERSYLDDRLGISSALAPNIVNAFAMTECGIVAVSKPNSQKMFVQSDIVFVEVLNSSGEVTDQGEGELIVTSAFNWFNPLLRYKTGDFAMLRSFPDGKQTIEHVRRGTELARIGPLGTRTDDIDRLLLKFSIWDFRLRVVGHTAFFIWSSRYVLENRSLEIADILKQQLSVQTCLVRRVLNVAKPGAKRIRYPSNKR